MQRIIPLTTEGKHGEDVVNTITLILATKSRGEEFTFTSPPNLKVEEQGATQQ